MAPLRSGFAIVSPASRGLGFAFAQQLLAHTNLPVIATARRDCDGLREHLLKDVKNDSSDAEKRLSVLNVDVTDESTISEMASNIRASYPEAFLRLAITLPGILHVEKSPKQIDANNALDSFKVNALGPMLLMKHLSSFLPNGSSPSFQDSPQPVVWQPPEWRIPSSHAIYAMMAARAGSISDNASGGWYSYRASKASVFQLTKTFDLYLQSHSKERAMAVAMHPGTVQTDFTRDYWKSRAMLQPAESATLLLKHLCVMRTGVNEGRGRCWDWNGNEVLP
ncbi:hypothetical protein BDW59DRAFT_142968 [Aspergillus cavernicola]|uniref:Short-chain dehydrogenase/reductase n=1 Tax=Aspergillus cavernicola TaxID=176166 RepID=A0ABR4IND5_9EURO